MYIYVYGIVNAKVLILILNNAFPNFLFIFTNLQLQIQTNNTSASTLAI